MKHPALFLTSARFEFTRFLRSPALVYMALTTPIAVYYMLPDHGAGYAILSVNGKTPVLTSSVLGLNLGVVAALLLTPLAYIFLKAGPTRRRPWQVSDVAPHARMVWTFGRWVSDTLVLWILLAGLTIAGLILGFFRLEGPPNIVETVAALWSPAAPALALVAAIRMVLDARSLTRNWFGDVIFFICWIALLGLSVAGSFDPQTGAMGQNPMLDAYGFAAPIINSVEGRVEQVLILGPSASGDMVIDAWAGVADPAYLIARGAWLGIAAGLALFAGLIWAPVKPSARRRQRAHAAAQAARSATGALPTFKAPDAVSVRAAGLPGALRGELSQLFANRIWLLILAAAAITAALTPFRTVGGPALLLALIFPLTEASARWQGRSLNAFVNTLGPDPLERAAARLLAYGLVAALVVSPAVLRMGLDGDFTWLSHAVIIAALVAMVAVLSGLVTRTAVTGRLVLLIGWYAYLSSA